MNPPPNLAFLSTQVTGSVLFHLEGHSPFEGLKIICGGLEPCRPEYAIHRDQFPYYCLEMVAAGSCQVDLGKGPVILGPGSFFSYGPGVPQRLQTVSGGPLVKYFVDFTGPSAFFLLERAGIKPGAMAHCPAADEARTLWDALIRLGQGGGLGATTHLLQALVAHLTLGSQKPRRSKPGEESFHRLRTYLDQNFLSTETLEGACRDLGLSPAYACRLFRTHLSMGPWKYLTRRRMKHAAALLSRGDASVTQVGQAMGYPDPYSFSRVFKKTFGVAPHFWVAKGFKKFKTGAKPPRGL